MLNTDVAIYLSRGWSDIYPCSLCQKQPGCDCTALQPKQSWDFLQPVRAGADGTGAGLAAFILETFLAPESDRAEEQERSLVE